MLLSPTKKHTKVYSVNLALCKYKNCCKHEFLIIGYQISNRWKGTFKYSIDSDLHCWHDHLNHRIDNHNNNSANIQVLMRYILITVTYYHALDLK